MIKCIQWLLLPSVLGLACCDENVTTGPRGDAAARPDSATEGPDATTPDAAAAAGSYVGGAGIGVSDMDASFAFYTDVMGMSLRYDLPVPGYVNEKILYFEESMGSDVVLMSYIDDRERNFENNPVKLVFYVPSASSTIEAIRAQGLAIVAEPMAQPAFGNAIVAFARDPDGYVLEIVEAAEAAQPYLGAVGLGVSDLDVSKDFYSRLLGMQARGDLIRVPGVWDEWIMQHESGQGSSVVLMHYTDGSTRNYTNVPVKTVHFVPDVRAVVDQLRQEGFPILSEPTEYTVEGVPALIALARDPDGYIVELVTTQ